VCDEVVCERELCVTEAEEKAEADGSAQPKKTNPTQRCGGKHLRETMKHSRVLKLGFSIDKC